jgi:2-polyprenyl-6-methoxyphenol hydroxylase-like FAD-dependent oxidoreductase
VWPPEARERAGRPLDTDVAIVGAGVVGAAIAGQLTRFELRVTLRPQRAQRLVDYAGHRPSK